MTGNYGWAPGQGGGSGYSLSGGFDAGIFCVPLTQNASAINSIVSHGA